MRVRDLGSLGLGVFGVFATGAATAVDVGSRQTLDTVGVYTPNALIEMQFDAQVRPPDYLPTNIASSAGTFTACKLTGTRGLHCLDGDAIRRWAPPVDAASESPAFSCRGALAASPRRGDNCTGLTVDDQGALWIVGLKGNTHSVVKLVDNGGACVSPSRGVPGSPYCATDFYSGRPPLVDVEPVDGDLATRFKPCPGGDARCVVNQRGVLAIESRRDVTFFPDPASASGPVTVVAGSAWGLANKETLLAGTLLQLDGFNGAVLNYVLVTTSAGRILARDVSAATVAGPAPTVFNIPTERSRPASTACPASTPQYAIRTSATSGTVYVTDRTACQVLALRAEVSGTATQPVLGLSNISDPLASDGADLTLSTASSAGAYSPFGVTVAPGVSIDLSRCTPTAPCPVIGSAAGKPAAAIRAVTLQPGSKSGVTIFQVLDIPDCRYIPTEPPCAAIIAQQYELERNGQLAEGDRLIVKLASGELGNNPATQMLNVKPLLPLQIRALYKGGLVPPVDAPLLISNTFRAQEDRGHFFDAIYAIAEDGVRFGDSFLFAFDVPLLDDPSRTIPEVGRRCQPSDGGRSLLDWDVMTRVSEKNPSVGGRYVDAMTNVACENPSMSEESSFSLLPYTLEVAPDTWNGGDSVTSQNDAVFARLVQKFYDDLEAVRATYACPASGARLYSNALCSSLANTWANGKQKLDKCIAAAFAPKQSSGDENCQSFLSQLSNFRGSIPTATPSTDTANRTGELKSRANVIRHVFETRFLPSIPVNGFCRELRLDDPNCPAPWPAQ